MAGARLGADAVRYSFIVADFHRLLLAGFTDALRSTPDKRQYRCGAENARHVPLAEVPRDVFLARRIWLDRKIETVRYCKRRTSGKSSPRDPKRCVCCTATALETAEKLPVPQRSQGIPA